jgi:hypothetical protein
VRVETLLDRGAELRELAGGGIDPLPGLALCLDRRAARHAQPPG